MIKNNKIKRRLFKKKSQSNSLFVLKVKKSETLLKKDEEIKGKIKEDSLNKEACLK